MNDIKAQGGFVQWIEPDERTGILTTYRETIRSAIETVHSVDRVLGADERSDKAALAYFCEIHGAKVVEGER